jgi:SAM-dependent methyltransferase
MALSTPGDHALVAYEVLAPHYDAFTAHHDYDGWTAALERLARRHGLHGRRLLDVACGTGKSFLPFLRRGYRVVGCDASPAMLARAAAKADVPLHVTDMRRLGTLGRFDLVLALDDAVNYLHDRDELTAACAGMARNLAPGGVLLFDANTLATYGGFFAATHVVETGDTLMLWRGRCAAQPAPGALAEATIDVFAGGRGRAVSRHLQRHHPEPVVRAALAAAGLTCVGVYGQRPDATFDCGVDETRHGKAIYLARRGESSEGR